MRNIPLRAYCISNMYFSGIHAGIQSAHALVDLQAKYNDPELLDLYPSNLGNYNDISMVEYIKEWQENHKTIVVLNGGSYDMLIQTLNACLKVDWPYASFHETEAAKGPVLTNIAVIMPDVKKLAEEYDVNNAYDSESVFIRHLSNMRLMS